MVSIIGTGALSSLGIGMQEMHASIEAGESGLHEDNQYNTLCGDISGDFDLSGFTETTYHYLDNAAAFMIGVIRMALDDSGMIITDENRYRTGFVSGTLWGCTATMEKFQTKLLESDPKYATPFLFSNSYPNSPASIASIEFGIKGYNTVYSGCENSGFMALWTGINAVHSGRCDTAVCVGVDALSQTVTDHYKDKTSPGDGAACILVSNEKGQQSIEITECTFGTAKEQKPVSPGALIIKVIDNEIIDENDSKIQAGNTMAAAFPLAVAVAVEKIQRRVFSECTVEFLSGNEYGVCRLRSGDR